MALYSYATLITISSSNNKISGITNPSNALPTAINGAITAKSNVSPLSVQQATYICSRLPVKVQQPFITRPTYHEVNI